MIVFLVINSKCHHLKLLCNNYEKENKKAQKKKLERRRYKGVACHNLKPSKP